MKCDRQLSRIIVTSATEEDIFSILQRRMGKALVGFQGGLPEGCDPWSLRGARPDTTLFPVPELVLLALRDVMGFPWSGHGEKVRWSIYATVEGEPFVFELRKFGFAIDHRDGVAPQLTRRVAGQLSASLRLLEPLLESRAREQISGGNLTMANKFAEFDNRYRYFRDLADASFHHSKEQVPSADEVLRGEDTSPISAFISARMNAHLQRQEQGYFASGAMVEAYFSRLEHRILLLRAFTGRPLDHYGFEAFLRKTWADRFREVVDTNSRHEHERLLGRLREVKEKIRNPLAHGGVENDGGAFYFHLDGIGAIPANLSRYRGRLQASFFPIADTTHSEFIQLFDEIDELLSSGALEMPNEFVRWGIDPQFDAATLESYALAIKSGPEAVDALIEFMSREWERHVNMDY